MTRHLQTVKSQSLTAAPVRESLGRPTRARSGYLAWLIVIEPEYLKA